LSDANRPTSSDIGSAKLDRIGRICLGLVVLAWLGNAIYAVGVPGGSLKEYSPALVAGSMIIFVIVHGSQQWGPKRVLTFALTIFVIGWVFETLGTNTGFPFGSYSYGQKMWPFVGHVLPIG